MKKIQLILLSLMLLFVAGTYAQTAKTEEIKIKVAFHCPNGKALIEKELVKEAGVTYVLADVETGIVTIKYDPKKQNKDKLVAAIEKIGYTTEFSKKDAVIQKACSHDEPQKKETQRN
jgi:periplasmic mercuric ion binding protein